MSLENPFDWEDQVNCFEAFHYAAEVVEGRIISCKYIKGAAKRFLKDIELSKNPESKYFFDVEYAERYLKLVQKFEHYIGTWETPNIKYQSWQKWVWAFALGFKHRWNPRIPKYRTIHIEIPRGCAKSTMASQCALFFLGLEKNRAGEKIACFATKSSQSRIILDGSRSMARKSEQYLKASNVKVLAHKLVDDSTDSEMVSMSSESKSMDGLNLRVAFLDELHAMSRDLYEVIISGQKKRNDSLTICCTTAGFSIEGIGFSQSQYAKKVALGELEDETFCAVVYTIDDNDDLFVEDTWKKANPNYGVSVDPIAFEAAAIKAREVPSDLANFKVKSLNCWISESAAFFNVDKWEACADPTLKIENFKNEYCYSAIDLASKTDLTAFGFLFRKNGHYYFFDKCHIPEKTVQEARNALYDNCIGDGYLFTTPGEAIHYNKLEEDFLLMIKNLRNHATFFDPWNAVSFSQNLEKKHVNVVEFRQTVANYSEPMKTLDALIREGRFHHNGSPLLKFCIGNVVAKADAAGNYYPRKSNESLKIDPIVCALMCLAGWINEKEEGSNYNDRGIRFL
jgi:phage terminase large subunit-like protein